MQHVINQNIKAFRESLGLSPREFAAKMSVSESLISLIENNHREPSAELIKKISEVYHIRQDRICADDFLPVFENRSPEPPTDNKA